MQASHEADDGQHVPSCVKEELPVANQRASDASDPDPPMNLHQRPGTHTILTF